MPSLTASSPIVGLDIAKAKVDVALLARGKFKSKVIENTPAGFAALLDWLAKQGAAHPSFVMEATGSYHEALALFLSDQGLEVFVINPARIKRYAEASMLRGKTDATDARLIARFFEAQRASLHPWVPPAAEVRRLRELSRRLEALKDLRQQEANRLDPAADAHVLASLTAVLATLDEQIAAIERSIHDHIDGHPGLKADRDLLASIPGLGALSIPILMAELPWRSFHCAAQAGAYAAGAHPTALRVRRHRPGQGAHREDPSAPAATRVVLSGHGRGTPQSDPARLLSAPARQRQNQDGRSGRHYAQDYPYSIWRPALRETLRPAAPRKISPAGLTRKTVSTSTISPMRPERVEARFPRTRMGPRCCRP